MQQSPSSGCGRAAQAPDPRVVAARLGRPGLPATAGEEVRRLECLSCASTTDHVRGPVTLGPDGVVLVQWWTCRACPDGRTVG
ncbi:hypothetical protein [Pimelobacter simplex]|uniref:hypothetical protein n=1 Tax=Nocardioides simplex TaxID=2045 RepID=UPI001931F48A|nr:hypothetical protein [Pimelobacter simplex]